jgi:hypothetical protein
VIVVYQEDRPLLSGHGVGSLTVRTRGDIDRDEQSGASLDVSLLAGKVRVQEATGGIEHHIHIPY